MVKTLLIYCLAAAAEIAGCFSFWAWLKLHKSPLWTLPGILCLILFAFLLTRVDVTAAGRTYAAYGAIYIAASIIWLWLVERQTPGQMGPGRFGDLSGRRRRHSFWAQISELRGYARPVCTSGITTP